MVGRAPVRGTILAGLLALVFCCATPVAGSSLWGGVRIAPYDPSGLPAHSGADPGAYGCGEGACTTGIASLVFQYTPLGWMVQVHFSGSGIGLDALVGPLGGSPQDGFSYEGRSTADRVVWGCLSGELDVSFDIGPLGAPFGGASAFSLQVNGNGPGPLNDGWTACWDWSLVGTI